MKRAFDWVKRNNLSKPGVGERVAVDLRKGRRRLDWKAAVLALVAAQITGWVLLFVVPGWVGIGTLAVVGVGAVAYDVRRQKKQNLLEDRVPPAKPD